MATKTAFESRTNHTSPSGALRGRWIVISERSHVGFRVKKMGLYHVKGRFKALDGTVEFAPGASRADIVVDASSVTTRMPPRDLHLRSGDFLDVKAHPAIAISADSVTSGPDHELRVPATFDIRGHRREVELVGRLHGDGQEELVLHLAGELDRHDFGIRPRQPFEMVVGRRVVLDVELVLAPDGGH
jgi:polyisoprenoid-binding protein YceI